MNIIDFLYRLYFYNYLVLNDQICIIDTDFLITVQDPEFLLCDNFYFFQIQIPSKGIPIHFFEQPASHRVVNIVG